MRAGALRSRITIQHRADVANDIGELVPTWATLAAVWADVRHTSGTEAIKADASASIVRASIRIRFRSDITAAMRALVGSTIYEVQAVLPDQRREYLDLVCEALQ